MADSPWKKFERRAAKLFGSVRTPLSGSNSRHTNSDSLHPDFFIEAKYRQKHAHHTLYSSTKALADREKKIPVVVTFQARAKTFLVILDKEHLLHFCRKYLESKGYKIVKARLEPDTKTKLSWGKNGIIHE